MQLHMWTWVSLVRVLARGTEDAQGRTMPAGVIPPPETAGVGSPLLSAVPQGKLRQGAAGTEERRYLEEELQLGTEAVQLPAPVCHRQVLLPVAAVQLSHGLCGMAGLSWHSPTRAPGTLPHPTPSPHCFLTPGPGDFCRRVKEEHALG